MWNDSLDLVVENSAGPGRGALTPLWIGPHMFLAQDQSGALFGVDVLTLARAPQFARLVVGDVVLAYQNGTLLVRRGPSFVVLDLRSGAVREVGLDFGAFSDGFQVAAFPAGGYVLSNDTATYRLD